MDIRPLHGSEVSSLARLYRRPGNAEAVKDFAHDTPADCSANASLVAKYFDGMREPPTDGRGTCTIKKIA
jgi:hypothetical protein